MMGLVFVDLVGGTLNDPSLARDLMLA